MRLGYGGRPAADYAAPVAEEVGPITAVPAGVLSLPDGAVHRRLGCPVIEVSEISIEETAQRVIRIVQQRRAEAKAS